MGTKDYLARQLTEFTRRIHLAPTIRFKLLYWGYRLFSHVHTRDVEWDFVLKYLPPVPNRTINILDVGSTSSLFIYELYRRGYEVFATDIRPYQEKLLEGMHFYNVSLFDIQPIGIFDYVTVISVLQHLGTGDYGGKEFKVKGGNEACAFKTIASFLKPNGKLLLTTFTEVFARRYKSFKGYNYSQLYKWSKDYFYIQDCEERKGTICLALIKK